jgi:hypothetical protein
MEEEYVKISLIISNGRNQELADLILNHVGQENVGIGGSADELVITCKKSIAEKVIAVIHKYDESSQVEIHPVQKPWV